MPKTTIYKCPDGTDFPVEWDDPAQEQVGWFWDQMHCPLPLSPLSADMWDDIGTGFSRGFDQTGNPGYPVWKRANGYVFGSFKLFDDDQQVRLQVHNRDAALREGRLIELWQQEYQPEVEVLTRGIRSLAAEVSPTSAPDVLAQLHAARQRHGALHMIAIGLTMELQSRLRELCKQEFGDEGELIAGDLLSGLYNKSVESGVELWRLAQAAKEAPAVEKLLREEKAGAFLDKLDAVAGGPEFRRKLDDFLEVYGHRNESFSELIFPTWREDPRFPLLMVRRYIDAAAERGPGGLHAAVTERREKRTREVKERLADQPERWAAFERTMRIAQQHPVLQEDHNFYIDQQGPAATRLVCLAFGDLLAGRGQIDAAADVFYLSEQELRAGLTAPSQNLRGRVDTARAARNLWMRVLPPASIGGGVFMPPPMQQFFGPIANEPMEAGAFRGVAGSAGQVRAVARLILTLDDIDRLSPGEILVTYATAPPWTPAFAIAGGIVTDIGGTLSHCAVVAREYGIPAVVGTRVATATIQDGQLITVDGTAGVVRVDE